MACCSNHNKRHLGVICCTICPVYSITRAQISASINDVVNHNSVFA